jgi:nucleoside-triphosphatase THEP1
MEKNLCSSYEKENITMNIIETINKTIYQEYIVSCIKCIGKTTHKVVASLDLFGEENEDDFSYQWESKYQIIQCQGCKSISFRISESNSEDIYTNECNETENMIFETLYPSRIEGRKCIVNDEIHYLPLKIQTIYNEILKALANELPVLACIGMRALCETIYKDKQPKPEPNTRLIDSLKNAKIITLSNADILFNILEIGNAAVHEIAKPSNNQLNGAMDIIEHLLKDLYILPKQAKLKFEKVTNE